LRKKLLKGGNIKKRGQTLEKRDRHLFKSKK